MKRINSLSDVLMEELANLLNAEHQLAEALPRMAEASESTILKTAFEEHLEATIDQADRIQDIFSNIRQDPQDVICRAVKEFIADGQEAINRTQKSPARDAAIINEAQRIEQYEIHRYKTACQHAEDLGHTRIVELLTKSLNEERAMIFHLNEMSQGIINHQALDSGGSLKAENGGFYIPEGKFKRGNIKKKSKNTDVTRFINEGNPNIQNPEDQGDLS